MLLRVAGAKKGKEKYRKEIYGKSKDRKVRDLVRGRMTKTAERGGSEEGE